MTEDRPYYGNTIVLLAFFIMSVQWAVIHSFGVFLNPLLLEFGWTRAATSGAFSLSSLLGGVIAIYIGWLNDRMGPRAVMSICGLLLGIGCILVAQTRTLWHFYLSFGIVIGLAMGGQFTPLMSTVARWFAARRGTMSGIVSAGVGIGALIGPQVANRLERLYGWRTAYAAIGGAALVMILIAAQFLKRAPEEASVSEGRRRRQKKTVKPRTGDGMTHRQAAIHLQYWLFMLTGFCYGYALFSLTVHVVAYALDKGLPATWAVGILSTFGGLSILGKVFFGQVCDRIGSKPTTLLGFSAITVAFLWLLLSRQAWSLYAGAGVFGFFYGACTVSQSPMTALLFGLKSHGLLLGVFGTFVTFGGALGPYVTGWLYDVTGSYQAAFWVCAFVGSIGGIAAANIQPRRIPSGDFQRNTAGGL